MSKDNSMAKQATKKAVKMITKGISLKAKLIIGGIAIFAMLFLLIVIGVVATIEQEKENNYNSVYSYGMAEVSEEVLRYRSDIERELAKYELTQYTDILLALMQHESSGLGNDPMGISEFQCGRGCIDSQDQSVELGVKRFVDLLKKSEYDIKLALQSYNFGENFITFVAQNDGVYTKELAIEYSKDMYEKYAQTGAYSCTTPTQIAHGACYGDIDYVDSVLRYLPSSVANGTIVAMGDEFNRVFGEMKKYEGFPYTFGGNSPATSFDCSSLMQWAFRQIGVNLPRTAQEQYDIAEKINLSELKAGDLVFFSETYDAGRDVTHVGMYVGNGMMYDANSGGIGFTDINTSYWQDHLYGYGRVFDFN